MKKQKKIGIIHGRFQVLHLGHIEYLMSAKTKCDYLYIGITNPDPGLTKVNENDSKRSLNASNPLTYYQRMELLKLAMEENGVEKESFCVVPFPINYPEYIKYYVPLNGVFFITIYDKWGEFKLKTLKAMGLETDLMWVRKMSDRFTTGTEVRDLIYNDKDWKHLVPKSTYEYIKKQNIVKQIKASFDEVTNI